MAPYMLCPARMARTDKVCHGAAIHGRRAATPAGLSAWRIVEFPDTNLDTRALRTSYGEIFRRCQELAVEGQAFDVPVE